MDGVKQVKVNTEIAMVTVQFDDQKTSMAQIKKKLAEKDFPIEGKVTFLKYY